MANSQSCNLPKREDEERASVYVCVCVYVRWRWIKHGLETRRRVRGCEGAGWGAPKGYRTQRGSEREREREAQKEEENKIKQVKRKLVSSSRTSSSSSSMTSSSTSTRKKLFLGIIWLREELFLLLFLLLEKPNSTRQNTFENVYQEKVLLDV